MYARSYVALVGAGVCVVSGLLIVLSLAGDNRDRDKISLQTSVILEMKDNPAATPAEQQPPGEIVTDSLPTRADAYAAPVEKQPAEETVAATLPTGTDPGPAGPTTSPPSGSHLTTVTEPEPAPAQEAALDVATANGKSGQAPVAAVKAPAKPKTLPAGKVRAKRKSASRGSEVNSILEFPRVFLRDFGWQL
jgi:hypothetical protein